VLLLQLPLPLAVQGTVLMPKRGPARREAGRGARAASLNAEGLATRASPAARRKADFD